MKTWVTVPTVWDSRYACEAAPLTSTTKQARVVALADKARLLDFRLAPVRETEAIFREIARHHEGAYVDAVRTGEPRHLAESQGFTWSRAFATSVAQVWHGHEHALSLLRQHSLVLHPVSGAHHAHAARGGGFCTFNYLIGTARRFLSLEDRCLIIDLDAHFGDGTAAFAASDERFALFDISGGVNGGRPVITTRQVGVLSFEVSTGKDYLHTLEQWLPIMLDTVRPKFVQYLAGADPYEADPVGSIRGMTVEALRDRDRYVLTEVTRRGIPMVVTLAGGYVPGVTERIHVNTIREMARALALPARVA